MMKNSHGIIKKLLVLYIAIVVMLITVVPVLRHPAMANDFAGKMPDEDYANIYRLIVQKDNIIVYKKNYHLLLRKMQKDNGDYIIHLQTDNFCPDTRYFYWFIQYDSATSDNRTKWLISDIVQQQGNTVGIRVHANKIPSSGVFTIMCIFNCKDKYNAIVEKFNKAKLELDSTVITSGTSGKAQPFGDKNNGVVSIINNNIVNNNSNVVNADKNTSKNIITKDKSGTQNTKSYIVIDRTHDGYSSELQCAYTHFKILNVPGNSTYYCMIHVPSGSTYRLDSMLNCPDEIRFYVNPKDFTSDNSDVVVKCYNNMGKFITSKVFSKDDFKQELSLTMQKNTNKKSNCNNDKISKDTANTKGTDCNDPLLPDDPLIGQFFFCYSIIALFVVIVMIILGITCTKAK
jgi:hypothetical protein